MEEGSDDPLELRQLAVSLDYLLYRIKDRVAVLVEQTETAVVEKQRAISEDYLGGQLAVDDTMEAIGRLEERCDELEADFAKLDQLYGFVNDFVDRLRKLEHGFKQTR